MNDNNKDMEQHELELIRMRKMKALMESQKRNQANQQQTTSIFQKVDRVLQAVLMPEAYVYFNNLKDKEPVVYQHIFNELVSPDVVQNIDYLVAATSRKALTRRVPLDVIIMVERKVKGIKG